MLAWMIQFSRRNVSRVISIATVASSLRAEMERNQSIVDADQRATRAYYRQWKEEGRALAGASQQQAQQKH
jgi:hypothetical protein